MSAIPVLMLMFSAILKLLKPASVIEGMGHFGYPVGLLLVLGILEFGSAVVNAIPMTSVLGAILVTAYLGGATATHVRVGHSWIMTVLLGALAWIGVYLREERLRALVPLRR